MTLSYKSKPKLRINVYIHNIQVVNIEVTELKILSIIVKKHCKVRNSIRSSSFPSNLENLFLKVLREGWDRHMTFSFKLQKPDKESMIQVCSVPLSYEYCVLHFV